MSNLTISQIIIEAQRMANRVKDMDALSSALLVEAEGNNSFVESLRQYQQDIESYNQVANGKTNVDFVNRIQQQNAINAEILKENRELKVCIEDYERVMELIMQKYREHSSNKVLNSQINFKDIYNEKLWKIIRDQRHKINEMATVMQRVAAIDDDIDLEAITRLRLENESLRELLQISKQFGTQNQSIRFNEFLLEEKGVQTEHGDESTDGSSLSGISVENINNDSVIQLNINPANLSDKENNKNLNDHENNIDDFENNISTVQQNSLSLISNDTNNNTSIHGVNNNINNNNSLNEISFENNTNLCEEETTTCEHAVDIYTNAMSVELEVLLQNAVDSAIISTNSDNLT